MLRIALAQINTTVGDLTGNAARIAEYARRAQAAGADLVVYPEMAVCGYPPEDLLFKDHFVRDNLKVLRGLAKTFRRQAGVVGFVDRDRQGRIFNAAAVLAAGRIAGVYHKQALPNYGVFDEKRYFTEGRTGGLFQRNNVLFGVSVCEDIWMEDGVCRRQARSGARLLINVSSSPYDFGKLAEREKLLKTRARQAGAYVAYVNLVGGQDELVFDGGSLIINPQGKILASAKAFEEACVVCDLPLTSAKSPRKKLSVITVPGTADIDQPPVKPALAPRLTPLERIRLALVTGTRDYMTKNGFRQAVIGLSGGIDSAVVAAIAVEAVGADHVVGVSMPSEFSSSGTRQDARLLAERLGIRFYEIPIQPVFQSYQQILGDAFAGRPADLTEENLQARVRGNILMALSNKFGWLVLTTGNKSEVAVGYCTLYGDMSGGFAVIKDVPKTKVYEIAELINNTHPGRIPQTIIDRPPTAELRAGQKDSDSLPEYPRLDPVLKAYVEDHQSLDQMARVFKDEAAIRKIMGLVDRSEYKRRQAPPGIKITARAFGKDWRLPITNKYKEF